jgi:hypothetical protein
MTLLGTAIIDDPMLTMADAAHSAIIDDVGFTMLDASSLGRQLLSTPGMLRDINITQLYESVISKKRLPTPASPRLFGGNMHGNGV